jgi:putative ABC transport system permease protein
MLKNYLTVAWRNLIRHKVFSLINILGLAIGMAACLLIWQYVGLEMSYDHHVPGADRIYRINTARYTQGTLVEKRSSTFGSLGPAALESYPEITAYTRIWGGRHNPVVLSTSRVKGEAVAYKEEKAWVADGNYLVLFGYRMLVGDARTAITQPNCAVISATTARRYFGREWQRPGHAIGRLLKVDGYYSNEMTTPYFRITGVFEDQPPTSHLKTDVIGSFVTISGNPEVARRWGANYINDYPVYTFLQLTPTANPLALERKLRDQYNAYKPNEPQEAVLSMMPLTDIHLRTEASDEAEPPGDWKMVYFLLLIGGLILTVAWINFINLTTARALSRAREVGVRKLAGAARSQLMAQFLTEAFLLNALAIVLALTFTQLTLPALSQFLHRDLSAFGRETHLLGWLLAGLLVMGTLLSGLYPAIIQSGFQPFTALKGRLPRLGGLSMRRVLVVFQFAVSVILMVGTMVVYRQLSFMRNQHLGMNLEQLLVIQPPTIRPATDSLFKSSIAYFKNELLRQPAVRQVAGSSVVPGNGLRVNIGMIKRVEAGPDEQNAVGFFFADGDFLQTYELRLLAGRNFLLADEFADQFGQNKGVILNESAVKGLGFSSPAAAIGKEIFTIPGPRRAPVIGVVQDFHQQALQKQITLAVIQFDASPNYFSVRLSTNHLPETIAAIKATYRQAFPGDPFDYYFMDEYFDRQYHEEQQLAKVIGFFAGLAIIIACLGLFGLAALATMQRTKEIGVRKVLGASVPRLVFLLSKDFVRLALIGNAFALPLAWWGTGKWLENYAFRIDISPWLFVFPTLLVLLIALLTVSMQTWKAARQNPVKALRYE